MKLFFLFILLTGLVFAVPSGSWTGVTSAATTPDFTMSAHPNMLTIPQGSAGKTIILLTSVNGFQGNVTLSPPASTVSMEPLSSQLHLHHSASHVQIGASARRASTSHPAELPPRPSPSTPQPALHLPTGS